ncbi:MAG: hypothetical protein M1812_001224 [Candelaria pacifica]|nr:MAG: hypothetical protein M1812_001224 [Candelaria pacifica]
MAITIQILLTIVVGGLATFTAWKAFYNVFLSPLRGIPGPFLAKLTSKWLTTLEMLGHRSETIMKAHKIYGPIVRLGPTELSFADPACIKQIYGQGTLFMKSARYEGFAASTPALFDMQDRALHRERRRLLTHAFQPSNVMAVEPLIAQQVRKFLNWVSLYEGCAESIDILQWVRMLTLDLIGTLFLGQDFGALDSETPPEFVNDNDDGFIMASLRYNTPWLVKLMHLLPISAVQHFAQSQKRALLYGRTAFNSYIDLYGRQPHSRKDLITLFIKGNGTSEPLDDEVIYNELTSLITGGTDTVGLTLTYLFWRLAKYPQWQERLRAELKSNEVQFSEGIPTLKAISTLPILDGIIMEGLRLHPAFLTGLPRVAPSKGSIIGEVFVPEGTIVSMQNRTLHRNPVVFPDPLTFNPARWIDTKGGTKEMKLSFIPWSKGPRACIGQHLATMELKIITASLVGGWDLKLAAGTTDESMAPRDYFPTFPRARECRLIISKAPE